LLSSANQILRGICNIIDLYQEINMLLALELAFLTTVLLPLNIAGIPGYVIISGKVLSGKLTFQKVTTN